MYSDRRRKIVYGVLLFVFLGAISTFAHNVISLRPGKYLAQIDAPGSELFYPSEKAIDDQPVEQSGTYAYVAALPGDSAGSPEKHVATMSLQDVSARAFISVFIDANNESHIILERNQFVKLPIASLAKLMTALIASESFHAGDVININKSALDVRAGGLSGQYFVGDSFLFSDALRALLISSHNEIAIAMAETVGTDEFIWRMNQKAQGLGLYNTYFVNTTGLDPKSVNESINYSTVADMAKLLRYIFEYQPHIFSILQESQHQFSELRSGREIQVKTTNRLLRNRYSGLSVLGGRTGHTPRARMNLAIVSNAPVAGYIVSVVIGSENSFVDMRIILRHISERLF